MENANISLKSFLERIPKAPSSDTLTDCEWVVADALKFNFMIHHPYWSAHGIFLDFQSYLKSSDEADYKSALKVLYVTYQKIREGITRVLLSDIPLKYTPSQISFALWKHFSVGQDMDKFIATKFESECERIGTLHDIDGDVLFTKLIENFKTIKIEIEVVLNTPPIDKKVAQGIDQKLQRCRNPVYDVRTLVYKRKLDENESEDVERKSKKIKTKQENSNEHRVFI